MSNRSSILRDYEVVNIKSSLAGLMFAGFLIDGCAGGTSSNSGTSGSGGAGTPTASISTTSSHTFNPPALTVAAGTIVTWTNVDASRHTATSDTNLWNSDSQYPSGIPSGSKFSFTVPANAASGTSYFYHCEFHGSPGSPVGTTVGSGMAGTITVK